MPTFHAELVKQIGSQIFAAAGATGHEARIVSDSLVEANLAGHDSHGILRIPEYVGWMEQKLVTMGAHIRIVQEADSFAVVDGGWGFGQVVGREAMELAITLPDVTPMAVLKFACEGESPPGTWTRLVCVSLRR